jgi:hypothetical protein
MSAVAAAVAVTLLKPCSVPRLGAETGLAAFPAAGLPAQGAIRDTLSSSVECQRAATTFALSHCRYSAAASSGTFATIHAMISSSAPAPTASAYGAPIHRARAPACSEPSGDIPTNMNT